MNITVKLFASLRKGRFEIKNMECEEKTTAGKICRQLEIKDDLLILLVNGRHVELNYVLSDSDVLAIFPIVGGG